MLACSDCTLTVELEDQLVILRYCGRQNAGSGSTGHRSGEAVHCILFCDWLDSESQPQEVDATFSGLSN